MAASSSSRFMAPSGRAQPRFTLVVGMAARATAKKSTTSSTGGGGRWAIGVPTSGTSTTMMSVDTGYRPIISSARCSPRNVP